MDTKTDNFGFRLRSLIEAKKLSVEKFADDYGIARSTAHLWLKRAAPPLEKHWKPLSEFFGVSESYLVSGRPKSDVSISPQALLSEVAMRYVPLLSWAHAGAAVNYDQIPSHEQDRIATTCTDPRAFAVTVEGESMLPDFKPGDRVIVAPSREPRNGKPVVAKLDDDGIVLRIYHKLNAQTIRLSSLRPEIYPSIDYPVASLQWAWPVEELNRRV